MGRRVPGPACGPTGRVLARALPARALRTLLGAAVALVAPLRSGAQPAETPLPVLAFAEAPLPLPGFAELEAAGATVGDVRVVTLEIFDTSDPKEDKWPFRLANSLHIQTRKSVIARTVLFRTGDPVSVRLIDETERVLRNTRSLYDVQIRPVALHDGVVDIEVSTRDTWSLDPGFSAGRSGGANSSGIHLKEYNLLGTGTAVSYAHSTTVDRSSNEFEFSNDHAFGTWASLAYSQARNSDGRRDAFSLVRPFYALDTRWAAGATASKDDRVDAVYRAGNVVSQYRHRQTRGELSGGWSDGLVGGWVQRTSVGLSLLDDSFAPEPGLVAPTGLPTNDRRVGPFVRYELIEDRFERLQNRNLIGRPEFFALGFASAVQLGWASAGLGSTRDTLLYTASLSQGHEPEPGHTLIAAATASGEYAAGQVRRQRLGLQAQYYRAQGERWLFYASAAADRVTRPDPADELVLGGDNGLRGYPLRYQSGERRALFTVEERFHTDVYPLRLFRIGGAAYLDVGRAWSGSNVNAADPGWLGDFGVGLRIVSVRSAFSNVLHVDLAFPIHPTSGIQKVQFLVKSKASF
jgi:hypothetical protein